ncbi:hypothetical protein XarbCFBP8132_19000 [Xanthomonas arboricola]|nr:hypothetical protein XarbCFBP8132_19000 [Xanthomonas arboricola]
MPTGHLRWSLPAYRRGLLRGMDAAQEPTRMYLRRVPRWWAGKGPQTGRRSNALRLRHSPVSEHWPKGPTIPSAALQATHAWHPSARRRPRPRP